MTQVRDADPALWEAFFGSGFCHHCGGKGTATRPLKRCAGCQRVRYCSKECQAAAFWHHRRAVPMDGSHAGCDRAGVGGRRDTAAPATATASAASPPPPPPQSQPAPAPVSAPAPAVEAGVAAPPAAEDPALVCLGCVPGGRKCVNCAWRMLVCHNYQGGCSRCQGTKGLFMPDRARGGLMCQLCAYKEEQSGEDPYEGVPLTDTPLPDGPSCRLRCAKCGSPPQPGEGLG
jgi:hypothetical protein